VTRRRTALVVGSVLALVSACGTTVPLSSQRAATSDGLGSGVDGTAAPLPTGAALPGSGPGTGRPGDPRTAVPSTGPSSRSRTPDATSTAQPERPESATGPLVVGYVTSKDLQATAGAIGLSGLATGDTDNQMRALAAYFNTRGGLLGRKISLVSVDVRSSDTTSNPDGTAASTCEAMAEKHVRVLVIAGQNPNLLACLKKRGIISIDSTNLRASSASYAKQGNFLFSPSAMSIDRYLPAVVDRLYARGFFGGWDVRAGDPGKAPVKVGVQAFDNEQGRHYVAVLDAALRRHGLKVDQSDLHSTDVAQNASATSAAVLRFAANGVTHVFDANVLFYKAAESQRYSPRYAIDDSVATPALLASNVASPGEKGQLHGSMGAGYLPAYEVPQPQDVSPAATWCLELMRKAGEDVKQSLVRVIVLSECDAMTFLASAVTAGGAATPSGMQQGLLALRGYSSTITYQGLPTQTHHDGARRVRDFVFDDDCGCFAFPDKQTFPVP
jgi:hypothetical protein